MNSKPITAFFGNSLTTGNLGIGFSSYLRTSEMTKLLFRGINGDTMLGVTSRVLSFLKRKHNTVHLQSLVIECGANDLLLPYVSGVDSNWALASKSLIQKGKEPVPNYKQFITSFAQRLETIIEVLSCCNIPASSIAVMTIPLLGEELSSWLNTQKRVFNTAIKNICNSTGIFCIDAESELEQIVTDSPAEIALDHHFFPTSESPDLFTSDAEFIAGDPDKADFLSNKRGLTVTVDGLHLNSRGALSVAKKVDEFLAGIFLDHQS
jgi:lysophospholipase L1-like esterase